MNVRRLSIIGAAAVVCAAAVVLFCSSPKFDNPLDEKGENYLCFNGTCSDDPEQLEDTTICDADNNCKTIAKLFVTLCDKSDPVITIHGPDPLVLKNDPQGNGERDFRKYVGKSADLFNGVATADKGSMEAKLFKSSGEEITPIPENLPPEGEYLIRYIATKEKCGEENIPRNEKNRTLKVEKWCGEDHAPPRVWWVTLGYEGSQNPSEIPFWKDSSFTIPELTADYGIGDPGSGAMIPKDSIMKSSRSTFENTANEGEFRLEYYVCKRLQNSDCTEGETKCDTTTRTVKVTKKPDVIITGGTVVIRLAPYKMDILGVSGNPYYTTDTLIEHGSTSSPKFRLPKESINDDVIEVFYVLNGAKHDLPKSVITRTTPREHKVSGETQYWEVEYKVEAGTGYSAKTERRRGYVRDNSGDCLQRAPSQSWVGGSSITIPKEAVWDYDASWNATCSDGSYNWNTSSNAKFGVDFSDNNFNYGYPEPGTYTIKFIAMGGCTKSSAAVYERTVKVE